MATPNVHSNESNPQVFLDITIGREAVGTIVLELFADIVPKTAENFRCLCTGEKGPKLHYKNTIFHRVIKGFMAQGGDISKGNGSGCVSIYGRKGALKDENFKIEHNTRGLLSMANSGPHSSGCQFFITFTATPHLDGKHVVLGRMISGEEVLQKMELVKTYKNEKPINHDNIAITNCGEILKPAKKKNNKDNKDNKDKDNKEKDNKDNNDNNSNYDNNNKNNKNDKSDNNDNNNNNNNKDNKDKDNKDIKDSKDNKDNKQDKNNNNNQNNNKKKNQEENIDNTKNKKIKR